MRCEESIESGEGGPRGPWERKLGVLGNDSFRALWLAGLISAAGSQVSRVSLVLFLFEQDGSVARLAWLILLETVPGTLVAPFAGAAADRFDKRSLMVGTDLSRMACLAVVVAWPSIGVIYIMAALQSIATAFFLPAKAAAVPLVVRRDQITDANGVDQGAANLVLVLGPVLGAELLTSFGLGVTLTLDALSFLLSALLITRVRVRPAAGAAAAVPPATALADAHAGWRYVASHPLLPQIVLLFFLSLLCTGLWMPLAPFFIRGFLGGAERVLGWQIGMVGAGAVVGALWAPRLVDRFGKGPVLFAGLLAEGLCMTVYSRLPSLTGSMVLMAVWGIAVSVIVVPFYSILQSIVDERFLGRVFALVRQSESCALIAAMAAALAAQSLPAQHVFLAAGLAYLGLTAVSAWTRPGRLLLATR